jgi:hypothetical protein
MRVLERFSRIGVVLGAVCAGLTLFSAVWLARGDDRLLDQIPKRRAQGKELRLEHHMALGFERAAWVGLVVGAAGVATLGWWGRKSPVGAPGGVAPAGGREPEAWVRPIPWGGVLVVGAVAMLVSGGLRWPRLGHSFWSDEAYAARAYVWGVNETLPDGAVGHRPVSWRDALFLNERANNQVWCSIEARVAHGIWRKLGGHPAEAFSERALRLPAFLWGVLTVGAVTVLGAMLAGRGGVAAGLLLAVHPWHVRFAAEMRGYSAMLLALTLGLIFLLLALRDGRWRWWLLGAAMNLWALLAFAGSAYVPLVTCGAAAGWLVWRRRGDQLARLLLANALAAVAFFWLYGPSISQLSAFLQRGTDAGAYTVSAAWLKQFAESLCLGVPWSVMGLEWRQATLLPSATAAAAAVAVIAILAALRTGAALRFEPRLLVLPAGLVVAALLSIGQSVAAGTLLLMWYLLPVVIGWVLLLGVGPRPAGTATAGSGVQTLLAGLEVVTMAVCLVVWTSVSVAMVALPRQPMREAALAAGGAGQGPSVIRPGTREEGSGTGPVIVVPEVGEAANRRLQAVAGISDGQMKLYAPDAVVLKSSADLEKAESLAAQQGKTLWVSVGGWEATRERLPEVMARLEGGAYEIAAELPGWEPMFSYRVWRRR